MCYRNLVVPTWRFARLPGQWNYIVRNTRLPILRSNSSTTYLSQLVTGRNYYDNNSKFCEHKAKMLLASGGFLFGLFDFGKEEEDPTSELIMTIKRSVLLIQRGEFDKAEQMLHVALRQAQTLQHFDGITYVYDVMANLAFNLEKYKKAETLFVSVLQRLLSKGTAQDDLKVIHISLKLAKVYEGTGDSEKADQGYNFCLENLQKHITENEENEDANMLLGLTSEWYASMLFSQSKYAEALKYFSQAYAICLKLNGEEHDQTAILLNDLGSVNGMIGEYDKAIEQLSKAAEIGKKIPDMVDLGSIHVNLGNVYIKRGLYEEARRYCNEGMRLAKNSEDQNSLIEAKRCLEEIKNLTT